MKPILIFRHLACEGPGYFQQVLHRNHIPYHIVFVDKGENIPDTLQNCSALVFMGGPMSVNDDLAWINQELKLIRMAVDNNMPVLGHCLGGQLICKALGGEVTANPVKEIGWLPVEKLPNTICDDWMQTLPQNFSAFHWHGETFSIPESGTRVLQSEHCSNQAFVIGNTLAMQCHIEMEADMVEEWAKLYQNELISDEPTVQSAAVMTEHIHQKIKELQSVADKIYLRWLQPLLSS